MFRMTVENETKVTMRNVLIEDDFSAVGSWYGGDYYEITKDNECISLNREEFENLYKKMTTIREMRDTY